MSLTQLVKLITGEFFADSPNLKDGCNMACLRWYCIWAKLTPISCIKDIISAGCADWQDMKILKQRLPWNLRSNMASALVSSDSHLSDKAKIAFRTIGRPFRLPLLKFIECWSMNLQCRIAVTWYWMLEIAYGLNWPLLFVFVKDIISSNFTEFMHDV